MAKLFNRRLSYHKNYGRISFFHYFYPMKIFLKLFTAIFLLNMVSCKPSPQKAQDYYDRITLPIEALLGKEDQLIQVINANMKKDSAGPFSDKKQANDTAAMVSQKALDMAFANFQMQIATSTNQMEAIGPFDKSTTLKDAAMGLLNEYKTVSENEYAELIKIVKIPEMEYTNEDDKNFLDLSDSIDNKLQRKISVYIQQVKLFAQQYNFQLEKDTVK
jgi:hypothetical protein